MAIKAHSTYAPIHQMFFLQKKLFPSIFRLNRLHFSDGQPLDLSHLRHFVTRKQKVYLTELSNNKRVL